MGLGVGSAQLNANTGLALWYHRVEESDDINALIEKLVCELLAQGCIVQHNRNDGAIAVLEIKASGCLSFFEVVDVPLLLVPELCRLTLQVEHLD